MKKHYSAISRAILVVVVVVILIVAGAAGYLALAGTSSSSSTLTSTSSSQSTSSSSLSSSVTTSTSQTTSTSPTVTPKQGGILTIAYAQEQINNFDPGATTRGDFSDTVIQNVFEGLVIYNYDHLIIPDLATSWTQPNATTIVFKLRQNVMFQDGTAFNASAVVFNVNRSLTSKSLRWNLQGLVTSAAALNNSAVQFNLNSTNYGNIFDNLAGLRGEIVSPSAIQKYGSSFGQHPVGTGPFVFSQNVPNDHVSLTANPNYWGGKPYLSQIVIQVVPDDSTAAESLQSGQIQIDGGEEAIGVPPLIATQIQKSSGIQLLISQPTQSIVAGIDANNLALQNPLVRQALNYAVDRNAIISAVQAGFAKPAWSPVLPGQAGYSASQNPYPPDGDTQKAKQLLTQAGYSKGINVTLEVSGSFENSLEIGSIMQQEYALAGINVNLYNVPFATLVKDVITNRNFSMAIYNFGESDAQGNVYEWYYPNPPNPVNHAFQNTSQITALLNQLDTTNPSDNATVSKLVQQIVNQSNTQGYGVFLFDTERVLGVSNNVVGLQQAWSINWYGIVVCNAALGINVWLNS